MSLIILLGIAVGVLILTALPRVRALRAGATLSSEILTGQFGNSATGEQFGRWFREKQSRDIQRQRFVQFAAAMGCPNGKVAKRVMASVMLAWKDPRLPYGSLLADEIDRLIIFDPPTTPAQEAKQRDARGMLDEFKAQLRALDNS
jgi:hypothetical protein